MSVPFLVRNDGGEFGIERRYHGRVLREWERNGYDDSDWYVLVMEDDGEFRSFCYSTTRGGSAPANADVDATDEVKAAYKEHQARMARITKVRKLREVIRQARGLNLTARQWAEVRLALDPRNGMEAFKDPDPRYSTGNEHWFTWANDNVFYAYEALRKLAADSFRSDFKRSLAEQVYAWATTPAAERKYEKPLSPKQLQYLG